MRNFLIILFLFLVACQPIEPLASFEFSSPTLPESTTSLPAIYERVAQNEGESVLFSNEEDSLWVHVYVNSSDEGGNFYKSIFVQDLPSNPNQAIRVDIDQTALSDYFPLGKKMAILLNGLGAGYQNGALALGRFNGSKIDPLPWYLSKNHFRTAQERGAIEPSPLFLNRIEEKDNGKWIVLEDVQFQQADVGKTYSGETYDLYDGERRLVQCGNYRSILLTTSTYSDFKSVVVPGNAGKVEGILTKDYYNEKWVLKINFPRNLHFENERCDPFFEENFEAAYHGVFQKEGWTNTREKGSQQWEVYADENALGQSVQISSYRSGDAETVSWLVSPKVSLAQLSHPKLAFRTSTKYADNSTLDVFYSLDWSGDEQTLTTATWLPLSARIAESDDNPLEWIESGFLVLPKADLFVGFRYSGSGKTAYDGTYELDDIRILDTD